MLPAQKSLPLPGSFADAAIPVALTNISSSSWLFSYGGNNATVFSTRSLVYLPYDSPFLSQSTPSTSSNDFQSACYSCSSLLTASVCGVRDCALTWGGSAITDSCGTCSGGRCDPSSLIFPEFYRVMIQF
jgi:hypothetical protein